MPRPKFSYPITLPDRTSPSGGHNAAQTTFSAEVIGVLRREGAVVIDPANIGSVTDQNTTNNLLLFGTCTGTRAADTVGSCSVVLKYGFKRDFNLFLQSLGPTAPVRTLTELRQFNTNNAANNAIRYRQDLLDVSDEMDLS